jgi:hypothetical protein
MIQSAILAEKHRVQTKLSEESASIHDYLVRASLAAKEITQLYGFQLKYADMPSQRSPDAGLDVQDCAEFVKAQHRPDEDETAYLLREPANARDLLEAAKELREKQTNPARELQDNKAQP